MYELTTKQIGNVTTIIGWTGSGKTYRVVQDALREIESGKHVFYLSGDIEGSINGVLTELNMLSLDEGENPHLQHFYLEKDVENLPLSKDRIDIDTPKIHLFLNWLGCWTLDMTVSLLSRLFPLVPENSIIVFDNFQFISEAIHLLPLLKHDVSFVVTGELDEHVIPFVDSFNQLISHAS